jgi:hypothetical protein
MAGALQVVEENRPVRREQGFKLLLKCPVPLTLPVRDLFMKRPDIAWSAIAYYITNAIISGTIFSPVFVFFMPERDNKQDFLFVSVLIIYSQIKSKFGNILPRVHPRVQTYVVHKIDITIDGDFPITSLTHIHTHTHSPLSPTHKPLDFYSLSSP